LRRISAQLTARHDATAGGDSRGLRTTPRKPTPSITSCAVDPALSALPSAAPDADAGDDAERGGRAPRGRASADLAVSLLTVRFSVMEVALAAAEATVDD